MSRVATAADNQSWFVAESPSTRVISESSAAIATQLLDELIAFRATLQQVVSVEASLPLTVFAVKDGQSLAAFAPRRLKRGDIHALGFSHTGPHAAFIAVRTDRPAPMIAETLRHEYVHVVTAAQSPEAPAWLDEGLAEFWGAAVVDGDRVVIGRPVAAHLAQLRRRKWLSWDTVLQQKRGVLPSNSNTLPLFYAQSWAMVHYQMLGQHSGGIAGFVPQGNLVPEQLESIRQYVADVAIREVSKPRSPAMQAHYPTTTMSQALALAERANMLVSGEQPQAALEVARRALSLNPSEALAVEVIGTYYFLSNQPGPAREWLQRSFATNASSYRAALYMSLLATTAAERERYLTLAVLNKPDSEVVWQRLRAIFEGDGRLEALRGWCRQWSQYSLAALLNGHPSHCGGGAHQ